MTVEERLPIQPPELASVPLFSQFGLDGRMASVRPGRVPSEFALPPTSLRVVAGDERPRGAKAAQPVLRSHAPSEVDWDQAATLRALASKRLTARLDGPPPTWRAAGNWVGP